jgi:hypothetical protein
MIFLVIDTKNYDLLLGLDFIMKIGAIVDVEKGVIQVWKGPSVTIEICLLMSICFKGFQCQKKQNTPR